MLFIVPTERYNGGMKRLGRILNIATGLSVLLFGLAAFAYCRNIWVDDCWSWRVGNAPDRAVYRTVWLDRGRICVNTVACDVPPPCGYHGYIVSRISWSRVIPNTQGWLGFERYGNDGRELSSGVRVPYWPLIPICTLLPLRFLWVRLKGKS